MTSLGCGGALLAALAPAILRPRLGLLGVESLARGCGTVVCRGLAGVPPPLRGCRPAAPLCRLPLKKLRKQHVLLLRQGRCSRKGGKLGGNDLGVQLMPSLRATPDSCQQPSPGGLTAPLNERSVGWVGVNRHVNVSVFKRSWTPPPVSLKCMIEQQLC